MVALGKLPQQPAEQEGVVPGMRNSSSENSQVLDVLISLKSNTKILQYLDG